MSVLLQCTPLGEAAATAGLTSLVQAVEAVKVRRAPHTQLHNTTIDAHTCCTHSCLGQLQPAMYAYTWLAQ